MALEGPVESPGAAHRLGLATVALHISAGLYLLIGLGCMVGALLYGTHLPDDFGTPGLIFLLGVYSLGLVGLIEVMVHAIARREFWGWVAGLVLFGIYVPSLFFPLGALGLWGLLDPGSRRQFGIGVRAAGE